MRAGSISRNLESIPSEYLDYPLSVYAAVLTMAFGQHEHLLFHIGEAVAFCQIRQNPVFFWIQRLVDPRQD